VIVNDELGIMWKETVVAFLRYYFRICLEGLRKTIINLSELTLKPGAKGAKS
jgi:hypothetical protein